METWAILGAYVLGFALLQVYLYRYLTNRNSSSESGAPPHGVSNPGGPVDGTPESDHGPAPADVPGTHSGGPDGRSDDDLVRCESCGTYNRQETFFVFCRACGSKL